MKFHILTLFPEMVLNGLNTSIIGRAATQGIISLNAVNIRDYTLDKHGKVDDYPYGGGAGMLMQAQPVYDAYKSLGNSVGDLQKKKLRTIYVTPQGRSFTQKMAEEFAKEEELVFLCGHYEGIDERVLEEIVTDYVSIGDYVLTGGELPAMVMIDAVSRLVPGVLNNEMSAETESFHNDLLEYPQYSRPEIWHDKAVPAVLLSGNHKNIVNWRKERSEERTALRRPDLYARYQKKLSALKMLSKKKREHIHMMELLTRGNGEILYHQGEDIVVYDRKSSAHIMTITNRENAVKAIGLIPEDASVFVVNQEYLIELLEEKFNTLSVKNCKQACYTRKEPLTVKHKDIRRLDMSYLDYVKVRCKEKEAYLRERLEKGMLYGVFLEDTICGFIGLHENGGMDMLYVEEASRGQGLAASLESWLINRILEFGWTPYCQVEAVNEAFIKLQEKLGLYLSVGDLYILKTNGSSVSK